MAYQIRVSPNALRAASARQREIGARVADIYSDVGSLSRWLDGAWDGNASEQALAGLQQMRAALKEMATCIENDAIRLNEIAQAFKDADGFVPYRTGLIPFKPGRFIMNIGFNASFSGGLRISPDEVRTVAKRIDQEGDELRYICSMLESHLRGLESEWEGRACRSFCQNLEKLIDGMERLSAEVTAFARKIYAAAERYEEMDNGLF